MASFLTNADLNNKQDKNNRASKFWFPLDNAAKIFPAILTEELTSVFRLSAILKHPVKIQSFLKAVAKADKRFPYYKVRLKEGFFWYYLEHIPVRIPVEVDDKKVCRGFRQNSLLLRILVIENKVSVEFSHILTDGGGAFEFLKTLLVQYFIELGREIPATFKYLSSKQEILEEEYEDSYQRYFKEDVPPMVGRSKAFHLPWTLNSRPRFHHQNIIIPLEQVKDVASKKGVSVNDFLVAAYLFILQEIYEENGMAGKQKNNKPIRVQVPVNLRKIFPSKTMRNFSLFVMPEIDLRLGHHTFDEMLKSVYHQIKLETDPKLINKNIARNVGSERKIYVKSIPLFLKSLILRTKYYSLGSNQYSGVMTNLGKAKFPPQAEELIDHFVFTPPPPNKLVKVSCGIIGFKDKLVLSFSNITDSMQLEEKFIRFFNDYAINAVFESKQKSEL